MHITDRSILFFFKYTSILSCFMIVLSVTVYCLNTMTLLEKRTAWKKARYAIDVFCMCWFTIEFVVRVLVCPDRGEFAKSISNWIDFISVLPSYLKLFSIRDHSILTNLIIIRLLRLFRFFKLSYGLQVLLHTLKASFYELILLLLILLIPIVIFSSLVHTIEKGLGKGGSKFDSIPATFWWCLITMTSVGYGDMVPETWAGKIIGSMCAICGVLIVALPISVIGSNFSLYYAHVRARLKLPSKDRKILAGNIRGLLKQPLSLSSRERDRRVSKRNTSSALKRKGAARSRATGDASILHSASVTSDEEFTSGSPANRVSTSENCLDWDSTAESSMKFIYHKPHRKKRRESKESTEHAIDLLVSGSDSCKEVDENINFRRKRRGGQISHQRLGSDTVREKCSSCKHSKETDSEVEEVTSNELKNENFPDGLSISSNTVKISPAASLERHINFRRYSPDRDSVTFSSRRTSMKLMELEKLPHSSENMSTGSGSFHAKIAIEDNQVNKYRKNCDDTALEEVSGTDLDGKSKFRMSKGIPKVVMTNHNTGYSENKYDFLSQICDQDYNVSDKTIPNRYPTENGVGRCHIRHELTNIRNSRSDSNLLPAIKPTSLPLFVSENELDIDGTHYFEQAYEDTKFGCE